MSRIQLYCLPFAGGSAVMFNRWLKYLDAHIEVIPLEFAGRGRRIGEPLYSSLTQGVKDIFNAWRRLQRDGPYAFFGHSLGAMMAYELAAAIKKSDLRPPGHVFFSGRPAPCQPRRDPKLRHRLPDDEFKAELLDLGGTASEFFDHPELLELMMPVIRNDFRIAEEYCFQEKVDPLDCDITILLGDEEDVLPEEAEAWRRHSSKSCVIRYFAGGHFFIQSQAESVTRLINETLLPIGRQTKAREAKPGTRHA